MGDNYVQNIERLVRSQREDQQRFAHTLEAMMAQVTQLSQLIEHRDHEIAELRSRPSAAPAPAGVGEALARMPVAEIAQQIPLFDYDGSSKLTLEMWLRKIDNVKSDNNVSNGLMRTLATNKFSGVVKDWYDSQENLWALTWPELTVKLREMFGSAKDIAKEMEKLRARKWKKGERLEDYYVEKLILA